MTDNLNPVENEPDTQENILNGEAPPDLLWIREGFDAIITTIYVYQDPVTKRLKFVTREPALFLKDEGLIEYPVESRWTVPTHSQLESYRSSSARYNTAARAVLLQKSAIEDLLVKNHLQEIFLGPEGHQTPLEIKKDSKGKISEESLEVINQLHPSVMDIMMAKYIDDAALIII